MGSIQVMSENSYARYDGRYFFFASHAIYTMVSMEAHFSLFASSCPLSNSFGFWQVEPHINWDGNSCTHKHIHTPPYRRKLIPAYMLYKYTLGYETALHDL